MLAKLVTPSRALSPEASARAQAAQKLPKIESREFPMRARLAGGRLVLTGYAFRYGPTEHPGGWTESFRRGCCKKTLQEQKIAVLELVDETEVLEFKDGTFEMIEDGEGLRVEASFDGKGLTPSEVSRLSIRMLLHFRVIQQAWNDDFTQRFIREVSVQIG